MYSIMDREMSRCSYYCVRYSDAYGVYEACKEFVINPRSSRFGDVLVKMKRGRIGVEFTLHLKKKWIWRPRCEIKYAKYFHWLFFMFWIDWVYDWVLDEVVVDFLKEENIKA